MAGPIKFPVAVFPGGWLGWGGAVIRDRAPLGPPTGLAHGDLVGPRLHNPEVLCTVDGFSAGLVLSLGLV